MINQDKPNVGVPETYLNVGSGFNLLVGGVYKLIVGSLGLAGMTNTAKPYVIPLWSASILPWQLPLPWLENVSGIDNTTKITSTMTNFAKP